LPGFLRPLWSANEPLRLCPRQGFAKGRKETGEGYEEILEEAEEGAGQDVQEQPEEDALSEATVLALRTDNSNFSFLPKAPDLRSNITLLLSWASIVGITPANKYFVNDAECVIN
jgi:hypothetical protein